MISELREGETIEIRLLVDTVETKKTKRGSSYLSMTLSDKSGKISAKMWNPIQAHFEGIKPGSVVDVSGGVGSYNGELDLNINRLLVYDAPDLDAVKESLILSTPYGCEFLYNYIGDVMIPGIVGHDLQTVVREAFDSYTVEQWYAARAATRVHHAFRGGLLQHIWSLIQLNISIAETYNRVQEARAIDHHVLVAASIMHDIGKIEENDANGERTQRGHLEGHLIIGLNHVPAGRSEQVDHLRHIMLSHHGKLEWGSPVVPISREANIFHLSDMIDSRMGIFDTLEQQMPKDATMGTYWSKHIGAPVFRPFQDNVPVVTVEQWYAARAATRVHHVLGEEVQW